jgi:hypothetical protein
MKLRALLAAAFVLTFGAAVAHASAASEFGLNAGVAMPFGDFGDVAGTGFFGGATYCYHVSDQYGLGGDFNYQSYGKKDFGLGSYTYSLINVGAHAKYFFKLKDSKEMPYAKVGLGIYNLRAKTTFTYPGLGTVTATGSDSKFGFSIGLGADWKMGESKSWGAEVLYHNIAADPSATMATVALRYNWLMAGK